MCEQVASHNAVTVVHEALAARCNSVYRSPRKTQQIVKPASRHSLLREKVRLAYLQDLRCFLVYDPINQCLPLLSKLVAVFNSWCIPFLHSSQLSQAALLNKLEVILQDTDSHVTRFTECISEYRGGFCDDICQAVHEFRV